MSRVEITDASGKVWVTPTEEDVVAVETPDPQLPTAIEVTEADSPTSLQVTEAAPPAQTVETTDTSVVEVVTAAPGAVALPVIDVPPVVEIDVPGAQGPRGLQGAPGEQGPPGSIDNASYIWPQNDPDSVWVIPHNLGYHPAVTVVDSGGTTVEGGVQYLDAHTVVVTFDLPFGGVAYLS